KPICPLKCAKDKSHTSPYLGAHKPPVRFLTKFDIRKSTLPWLSLYFSSLYFAVNKRVKLLKLYLIYGVKFILRLKIIRWAGMSLKLFKLYFGSYTTAVILQ